LVRGSKTKACVIEDAIHDRAQCLGEQGGGRIIKAMEKPPYVSSKDIESLLQIIKESKQPAHFESPFELSSKIR